MVYRPAQVYNGSGWDDIGDKRIGAESGDIPQASVTDLTSDLASKWNVEIADSAPGTPAEGDAWVDTTGSSTIPKIYNGTAWQEFGVGKILQIVRATDSTDRTTTSTSFVDVTGMSVTITPTKSDSAIIVACFGHFRMRSDSSNNETFGSVQITDSSNNPLSGAEGTTGSGILQIGGSGLSTVTYVLPIALFGYSTPATTSATTYKVRFVMGATKTTQVQMLNGQVTGQVYAIEVGA